MKDTSNLDTTKGSAEVTGNFAKTTQNLCSVKNCWENFSSTARLPTRQEIRKNMKSIWKKPTSKIKWDMTNMMCTQQRKHWDAREENYMFQLLWGQQIGKKRRSKAQTKKPKLTKEEERGKDNEVPKGNRDVRGNIDLVDGEISTLKAVFYCHRWLWCWANS